MPAGLANLLADRQQFLDLVAYLAAVAVGGPARAAEWAPDPLLLAQQEPAAYEKEIDHAAALKVKEAVLRSKLRKVQEATKASKRRIRSLRS